MSETKEGEQPFRSGDWYGYCLPFPDCEFVHQEDDPIVQQVVDQIKKMVFESLGNIPFKVINEQVVISEPFQICEHAGHSGLIGWKGQIFRNEGCENE